MLEKKPMILLRKSLSLPRCERLQLVVVYSLGGVKNRPTRMKEASSVTVNFTEHILSFSLILSYVPIHHSNAWWHKAFRK